MVRGFIASLGRDDIPEVSPVRKGPYNVMLLGQNPSGSGAERTRQIGFTNDDPSGRFVRRIAASVSRGLSTILPWNICPGFGMTRCSISERREGHRILVALLAATGVSKVLAAGKPAKDALVRWPIDGIEVVGLPEAHSGGLASGMASRRD